MRAGKIGLLIVILAFGSTVETAWRVRNHLGLDQWGWGVLRGRFYGPSFTFDAEQTETVSADTAVEVENAFGGVTVTAGAPGQVRIALRKVVFLPQAERARAFADRLVVQARREGGILRVGTNRADLERTSGLEREVGFETHFDLVVPPGTAVKVASAHGPVHLSDVARADVSSSFDTVRVERVAGPATIDARHGDVRVEGVKGEVKVTDRHGDVTLQDVDGRAEVDMQHGDFVATRVGGLTLQAAHGDVRVEAVHGDLDVHTQHGEVRAHDVSGRALVETSFQGVTLGKVGGDATVHTEHGEIQVSDVGGAVDAKATFDDVALARIAGPVTVTVTHGAVRAQGVEKGARIHGSGDEVVLDGFRGPVDVDVELGGVRLVPAAAVTEAVRVTATHGAIEMDVPAGSRFLLQASAQPGEIASDVRDLSITQTGMGHLAGSIGGGGAAVVLTTHHGDVRLRSSATVAQKTP